MSDYASRYRAARAYANLSRKELAEQLGVSVETIKRREYGTDDPKLSERIAVSLVCGVPADFMEHGFDHEPQDDAPANEATDDVGLADQIAQQNELLARQSQILERIEGLVGVLRDVDVEVTEPRGDSPAPTDEHAKIPAPPDLPAPPAVEPIRRRGARGTRRSA